MSPLQALKELLNDRFYTEDGEVREIRVVKGLTNTEIDAFKQLLPGKGIPDDIAELLRFAAGIKCDFPEDINFSNIDSFNLEAFFPNLAELSGDGLGNFWLVDIDYEGNWGPVYYACHDPAVIMKQSENLTQFIIQLHGLFKEGENSLFHQLYDEVPYQINRLPHGGFINRDEAKSAGDLVLKEFAATLPPEYLVADLRNKPVGSGFAWGRYYSVQDRDIRCKDLPLWGLKPKQPKGFWARLFGRK